MALSTLQAVSASPLIREYSQGAAQRNIQPCAQFIAPLVTVSTAVGRYKKWDERTRFSVPDTKRALGGRAVEIGFNLKDATYNCTPNAIDCPLDIAAIGEAEQGDLESLMQEGADMCSEVGALSHEQAVVTAALAAAGGGSTYHWGTANTPTDPVADIDAAILQVIRAAKYGSAMGARIVFGASAWNVFKNSPLIKSRFVVGVGAKGGPAGPAFSVVTEESASGLFIGSPEIMVPFTVYETAAPGVASTVNAGSSSTVQFLMETAVLVFAAKAAPSRHDPSFMKTFRLNGQYLVPGSYLRDDGRVQVAKFDWSEDIQVTNTQAVVRLNPTLS